MQVVSSQEDGSCCSSNSDTRGFFRFDIRIGGILTRMDLKKAEQLPALEEGGMKSEVIIEKKHEILYNHADITKEVTKSLIL